MAVTDSRVVTVFGPKDTKTTTLAMIGSCVAAHRDVPVFGIDANPDMGTLLRRLGGARTDAKSLVELVAATDGRSDLSFAELAPFVTAAGGVWVCSNDRVNPDRVAALGSADYRAVIGGMRQLGGVVLIDNGRSQTGPGVQAALQESDHLVIAMPAKAADIELTTAALRFLLDAGYGDLVASATVVCTATHPDTDFTAFHDVLFSPAGFSGRARRVVTVPYDVAAALCGGLSWDALRTGTQDAYLEVAAAVGASFSAYPMSLTRSDSKQSEPATRGVTAAPDAAPITDPAINLGSIV